ncbi:mucin TcMUCII, putative [Trypanosoma cruzi marinkellei]|uniref:Mucin TcMUCII, putative n=1 Tax=Trypanosoma cruzi marinkellei TaxID=85056 RepID=K2N2Q4_TRYCR|nr:mucin TcMUCII, putative [Trypanosoma cruzi marinkellei]
MMTMCRLLCALLVLALCCCPAVCVTEDDDGKLASLTSSPSQSQVEDNLKKEYSDKRTVAVMGGAGEPGQSGLDVAGEALGELPTKHKGESTYDHSGLAGGKPIPPGSTIISNESVVNSPEHNAVNSKNNQEAKVQTTNTTTTTTTKAPTTTTTTTTTAPEAPSITKNTQMPSTTTTRAPSRLREIDGSLSSSAWVCAPLLLAVSALAYTAVC